MSRSIHERVTRAVAATDPDILLDLISIRLGRAGWTPEDLDRIWNAADNCTASVSDFIAGLEPNGEQA